MFFRKLFRSIEQMPHAAYIYLKFVLAETAAMLVLSLLLRVWCTASRPAMHMAQLLLRSPAGVLSIGLLGLAAMLDRLA